jgi:hypothetical protein
MMTDKVTTSSMARGDLIGPAKGLRDRVAGAETGRRRGVGPGQVFDRTEPLPRRITAGIRHHWTSFWKMGSYEIEGVEETLVACYAGRNSMHR